MLLINLIFHAVAWAFYDDCLRMVEEPVKDGGGKGAVVVEDAGPFFIYPVGGDESGGLFIAEAEGLEEDVGALFINREIAQLIDEQEVGLKVFLQFRFHAAGSLSG